MEGLAVVHGHGLNVEPGHRRAWTHRVHVLQLIDHTTQRPAEPEENLDVRWIEGSTAILGLALTTPLTRAFIFTRSALSGAARAQWPGATYSGDLRVAASTSSGVIKTVV